MLPAVPAGNGQMSVRHLVGIGQRIDVRPGCRRRPVAARRPSGSLAERAPPGGEGVSPDVVRVEPGGDRLRLGGIATGVLEAATHLGGDASITTTANVYGHMTDTMLGRAAERADAILAGRRTATR
jgi:hypothetical protein